MGRGRTATGTVIACLVKLRCDFGRPVRLPSIPGAASNVDMESSSGDEAGNEMEMYSSTSAIIAIEKQNSVSSFVMDDIPLVRKITGKWRSEPRNFGCYYRPMCWNAKPAPGHFALQKSV